MTPETLATLVADLTPRNWSETRRRADVLEAYLAIERPSVEDAMRAGAAMGIGLQPFYRIATLYKASGSPRHTIETRGGGGRLDDALDGIVADAVRAAGPGAPLAAIIRQVESLCAAAGLANPSANAVKSRIARMDAAMARAPDVARALRRKGDLVLDAAGVDILLDMPGGPQPAALAVVVCIPTGRILAHRLVAGRPSAIDLADLIAPELGAAGGPRRTLLVTKDLADVPGELVAQLSEHGIALDLAGSRQLGTGSALHAVFGSRIGKVSISRSWPNRHPPAFAPTLVEDAVAVIDLLVARRNASIAR
ncbi:MAG: hypothetical protein J0J06_03760 [Sphingomonas sp.]|uniref:hypothetical protein n=1 Tax=Sphingomonas sp. TaxID=28214 RepID=UPI001AC78D75|nr:hypothetical protein [Sphingomonas sp.]MBN8814548.1 hypothetical protein [Sphingomonas sp.]